MVKLSLAEAPVLDRAVSALEAGELVEAEQLCEQIVAATPDFFDAVYLLAVVQSKLGKKTAALASFARALSLQPGNAMAHFNRANTLDDLKRYDEALASYELAIHLRPDFAAAYFNRGNVLQALSRYDEALASYDRSLALRPEHAAAHSNRGNVLQMLKRYDEALASYDRALAVQADFALAHYNRGNVLQDLNRYDEALASYDRALAVRPDFAEALSNRGNVLQRLKRFVDAMASYDRALASRPDFAEAFSNRGAALQELKRHEEALASYERATEASPKYADAHYNQALCRLLLGDFDRGWEKYEWRWQVDQLRNSKRSFTQPLWLGQNEIAAKTILLYAEQGFGDTIQFCRYVPLVAARAARVILEVQRPLKELMSGLAGATHVVSRGEPLPHFDVQCPLLSLPLAFRTRLESIPATVPYLRAPPDDVTNWNTRLGPGSRPRIGLAWSGLPTHKNDHNRSIPLSALLSLLEVDATFVSVQKDVRREDAATLQARSDLRYFGDALKNFSDTAALISNLDLVIAIDTSVAHLAAALAKPVWVLLPFAPDWRWLLDRDDSPWYPTARLFRQDDTHTWDGVIARVRAALRDFAMRNLPHNAPASRRPASNIEAAHSRARAKNSPESSA